MTALPDVTIELSRPIDVDGKTVASLTFREANVGDLVSSDLVKGDIAKSAAVLACMAGLSLPDFKRVSARDMHRIMDQADHLMGNAPAPAADAA